MCDSGLYSREIINMFLVSEVSGLVRNFYIVIYADTINVINVKLCMKVLLKVLLIEHCLFIRFSVTFTAMLNSFNRKCYVLYLIKFKL